MVDREVAKAAVTSSPDKAAEPVVFCPDCNLQLVGSRNQGSGSGWLSDPTLWLHQTAHQTSGTCEETRHIK